MRILIDTNIYLDFYRNDNTAIELLKTLTQLSEKIILTQQLVDEFERNREKTLNIVQEEFQKTTQLQNIPGVLIHDSADLEEFTDIRNKYNAKRTEITRKISALINNEAIDPVATIFQDIVEKSKRTNRLWQVNENILQKAQKRKLLGNPPTSDGKFSLGDEITWELILENEKDDLIIISRDGTHPKHVNFLKKEFNRRTGKQILAVTGKILEASKIASLDISPNLEVIEDLMVHGPSPIQFVDTGATFVLTKRTNNEYMFQLQAPSGQIILSSEGYVSKSGCHNGISLIQKYSNDENCYDRKNSSNGKYYFTVKPPNRAIIATSQMYESQSGRDNGIELVKKHGQSGVILDIS